MIKIFIRIKFFSFNEKKWKKRLARLENCRLCNK